MHALFFSFREVAQITGANFSGKDPGKDQWVTGVCVDSRNGKPGQLFIALKGEKVDGHYFIEDAITKGCKAAIVELNYPYLHDQMELIKVADPLKALQQMAKAALLKEKSQIVAVTGSVGKTTTKEMIGALLSPFYRTKVSPGNHNSQIGLPLTILNHTDGKEEIIVLEMAMSEAGQLANLISIAPPDVAVLTAVGLAHASNFCSVEEIAFAKGEIFGFACTKLGIIAQNIPCYKEICQKTAYPMHSFAVNSLADYTISSCSQKLISHLENHCISLKHFSLEGKHNLHNLLAAVAVARYFQLSWEAIEARLPFLKLPEKRFERVVKNNIVFINDSYNACELSIKAALESLPQPTKGGKKIAVFGSLLELGAFSQECHFRIGQYALEFVDECHCYGLECQPIVDLWKKKGRLASLHSDFMSLMEVLKKRICSYDVVLLKGSNQKKLWQVIDAFTNEDKR